MDEFLELFVRLKDDAVERGVFDDPEDGLRALGHTREDLAVIRSW